MHIYIYMYVYSYIYVNTCVCVLICSRIQYRCTNDKQVYVYQRATKTHVSCLKAHCVPYRRITFVGLWAY